MPGDDEEYELLTHKELERLRDDAHRGDGDFLDAINVFRQTHESIQDLRRLLGSVKDNILEDYAKSPNPESLLEQVKDQNEQIAESLVSVLERMEKLEDRQDTIIEKLESGQDANDDSRTTTQTAHPQTGEPTGDAGPSPSQEENHPGSTGASSQPGGNQEQGMAELDQADDDDDFPSLDGGLDAELDDEPLDDDDSGFFSNLIGG